MTGIEGAPLVDTHCHLFLMDGDAAAHVADARLAGVDALVCAGIDAETSRRSRELADSLAGVFATSGVHPHSADEWTPQTGSVIEALLDDPRVVAVGETGLDYFRLLAPAEDQRRVFRQHCALARETGKALVVHTREAWSDVLAILEDEAVERVVLHCFSGDAAAAREAAARGYFCSFAGILTYPTNDALREAAAAVPEELLLVETDSPFLPPQEVRGSTNEPGNVRMVVAELARIRGVEPSHVAALTFENARRAFGLPDGSDEPTH